MPSQAIINFKVNTIPQNCMITINPEIGNALNTSYLISVSGCQDND